MARFPWKRFRENQTMHSDATRLVRFQAAANLFKREILGEGHNVETAQTGSLYAALGKKIAVQGPRKATKFHFGVTERTWASWFTELPVIPKRIKLRALDRAAEAVNSIAKPRDVSKPSLPAHYFSSLVYDGLLKRMLTSTRSKEPLRTLEERAENYTPTSALHLHFDALDACALVEGFHDVPWQQVKAIAAARVLRLLNERWGRRGGTVYKDFPSDLKLQLTIVNDKERDEIRASYASLKPDLFDHFMTDGALPDWDLTGIERDASWTHIYKAIFAIGADGNFLQADRFDAWYLDFATAGLALLARAWSDRYQTFGASFSPECLFFHAFDSLLFSDLDWNKIKGRVVAAMHECGADWSETGTEKLLSARSRYCSEMSQLGIPVESIKYIAMTACRTHALVYQG